MKNCVIRLPICNKKEPDTLRRGQHCVEIEWDLPEQDIGRRVDIYVVCVVAC